jgi:hypothetical protein
MHKCQLLGIELGHPDMSRPAPAMRLELLDVVEETLHLRGTCGISCLGIHIPGDVAVRHEVGDWTAL